ncbi:MAG: YiiX family permuted papain-like enzyme [Sphingobacteriaceae bacterium]|nr:YiiX family permuted papain-like enzyme [Sphingobacteriaceae bacterium]
MRYTCMRKKLLFFTALLAVTFFSAFHGTIGFSKLKRSNGPALKSGDIIFIINPAGQGKAIQLATKSKYTHVGIVFIEDGKTYVYHAVEPVSKSTLSDFISMSEDGTYSIKRLKDQGLLTDKILKQMSSEANLKLGIHYDLGFNWSDEELYCSEYVWKLYDHALKIELGKLRPLKEFDLSHPKVQQIMKQRYGKHIPYEEKMISPGDMYNSTLLEEIKLQ